MKKVVKGIMLTLLFVSFLAGARAAEYADPLEVVTTITLDKEPLCIAVNEETNRVYVGVEGGLMVIDGEIDEVVGEIPLEVDSLSKEVEAIAINPQTNRIYVSDSGEKIIVIDGATNQQVGELAEGIYRQYEIAVNPVTNFVYIADWTVVLYEYDCIRVYDGETLTEVTSVGIPGSNQYPYIERVGVAVNPDTNRIYATWSGLDRLYVIDGDTHQIINNTKHIGEFSETVRVNPYTNYVYIGKTNFVYDGETLERVPTDYQGYIKAVNPRFNFLYSTWGQNLYILNGTTHETLASLELDWRISSLAIHDPVVANTKTGKIYLVHEDENKISVVQGPPYPPKLMVSDLSLVPERVEVREPFTVTVNVTNVGDLEGTETVTVLINGEAEQTKEVTLAGDQSATVEFEFIKDIGGTYTVEVDGLSAMLVVTQFVVSDLTISPAEVVTGETAVITANVTNLGDSMGSYLVILKINGVEVMQEEVDLDGRESRITEFQMVVPSDVTGKYTVEVDGLTGTYVVRSPRPAEFEASQLLISPSEVEAGKAVTITVNITNTGELEGMHNVILKVNNQMEPIKDVNLSGGESTIVTFTLTKDVAETYNIEVNGQTGTLTVTETPPPPEPFPTWIVAAIAIIVAVGAVLLVYLAKVKKN